MGIPASNRLRKPREFQAVRTLGHQIHCGPFIFQCHVCESLTARRLGIVASGRIGKAVIRSDGNEDIRGAVPTAAQFA